MSEGGFELAHFAFVGRGVLQLGFQSRFFEDPTWGIQPVSSVIGALEGGYR